MDNDIQKIEQVLYRTCQAVDQGDIDCFVNLFHQKGTLLITWEENGKYTGHGEIRSWITNYDKNLRASLKYLRHKITCPVIDINGDNASVYSYLDVEAASKDNQVTITVGHYEDKLIRKGDKWLLKEKNVFMDNMYNI